MQDRASLQDNPWGNYRKSSFSRGRSPFLKIKSKIRNIVFWVRKKLHIILGKPHLSSKDKYLSASQRRKRLYLRTYLASIALVLVAGGFFLVIIVFAVFSRDLPNPNQLLERTYELSTRFYDKNGELLYEVYGDKNRTLVKLEDVSPDVAHATLSAEDSEFYLHKGYSLRGIFRALKNIVTGGGLQGGSTLTQQAIKNSLLTQDRTITRKIKELILSLQLENRYTKDEIMQMYLNESPYGGLNYGIYSAAKAYFNKTPKDLTLSESAYLAGLTQSPTYYSQFGSNPEAGIERRNYVLYLMKERGWVAADGKRYYISQEEHDRAREEVLKFDMEKVPVEAPHFVYYVKQFLVDILGTEAVETGGLRVTTTLDLKAQRLAQDIVTKEIETNKKSLNMYNGVMVVLDPKTGGILAMVGSRGYNLDPEPLNCVSGGTGENSCKFDPYVNVTMSKRQPGSAIKPITYATLLSQGYTAAYPLLDVPTKFEGAAPDQPYVPVNYDGKFRGPMSMRKALGNSINVAAVKALKIAGIGNMIDQAEKMGITTFKDRTRYGLALTLGGGETKLLELTGAFAVFADKGIYKQPIPIIEVTDSKGNVIYRPSDTNKRVLSEENAFIISDILSDDGARSEVFGAGSLLNIYGRQVAVKTGTTDDKRDNYAIGYTPSVVAGVWVGNNNNEKMNPYVASGISGATPIWNKFMTAYLKDNPVEKFEAPKTVKKMEVDKLTGGLPYKDYDKRNEWFAQNTEPTAVSDWYQRITICEVDGRIANSGCIDADKDKTVDFIKVKAELPIWQSDVDAWIKENYNNDKKYFPPLMTSKLEFDGDSVSNKDEVFTQIVGIKSGDLVPLTFRLTAEVSCANDVDKVTFYMDDENKGEDSKAPYAKTFELKASDIGIHKFRVVAKDDKGNKGEHEISLNVIGYTN
ncbi:transglycosylase domain-containing protein [Patescibacteria group bacterium]|nr:transglycosylase domain-containing protein [Patescibacteria group bacterium]MBU1952812.1 transglycosylase domain-containing protein [Patescibacteria group bacterium]